MLYWCIHNNILWNLCDRLATSLLKIAISGLWSGMYSFTGQTVVMKLSRPFSISSASPSVLLWHVSMFVKLLLANSVGHSTALLGVSFLGNCILFLTWRRLFLRMTPNASVAKYSYCISLYNASVTFSMMMFWLWHTGFGLCCSRSQSRFNSVCFCSGSHISVLESENVPK